MEIKENYSTASTQELTLTFVDLADLTHNVHQFHSELDNILNILHCPLPCHTHHKLFLG